MPLYGGFFMSPEQLIARTPSVKRLTQTVNQIDANAIIQEAMTLCKLDLKERISLRAQGIFPDSIAYYKGIWERAQKKLYSTFYPSGFPAFGYVSIYGTFVDITTTGYTDTPFVYISFGVPDNNKYSAENGSFCWDTRFQVIYINRGTKEINQWELFISEDLVDYITNPQDLQNAFYYGTLYYLFENKATEVVSNNQILNLQLYSGQEQRYCEKYEERCKRAMSLINMDISNGGLITSFDTKFQRATAWGIV